MSYPYELKRFPCLPGSEELETAIKWSALHINYVSLRAPLLDDFRNNNLSG